jgi:acyl-CoA synthetase (NDP forming)
LVGASGDARKNTARPQRYLQKHGYQGKIIPINPNRNEVLGIPAWPDLNSAPGPIDHAFIMVPAAAVPGVITECAGAGITVATIYSDGFAEAGDEGLRRQRDIVDIAKREKERLIGPNSMGVINCRTPTPITVNAALDAPALIPGSLGVISQSGTILGTLISRGQARGIGFCKLISVGNEADLGVAEIGHLLIDNPDTRAILLFLESIRDPNGLAVMARLAFDAGKSVIAYKLGRSEAGRELAVSHSGAIAGSDAAATAYFRHHGIIRVDMLETMLEIPALLIGRQPTCRRRAAVLTTTGGGGAMVVDRLGALDVEVISPPEKLVRRLAAKGLQLGDTPLIDLTMAGANEEIYGMALEELLASNDCDAVVAVVGSSAQFHPEIAVEPILATGKPDKPLAVFLVPQADRSLELLAEAGIAAFRTPESCAEAVRAFLDWAPPVPNPPPADQNLDDARTSLARATSSVLDEMQSGAVFEAIGIEVAPAQLLEASDDVLHVDFPVAAKLVSPDLPHKTEVGGVVLDIADTTQLVAAMREMQERADRLRPGVKINGILVQHMEQGVIEVLIGYKDNPETGPIVVCGLGGSFAEYIRDIAIRLAPVSPTTAQAMIKEAFGRVKVRGGKFQEIVDCAALASAIAALSNLARNGEVKIFEAEINPLIVREIGNGVVAVDGLIVLQKSRYTKDHSGRS